MCGICRIDVHLYLFILVCYIKGVLHPNIKSACFVCYLKLFNTFSTKQIVHGSESKLYKKLLNGSEIKIN